MWVGCEQLPQAVDEMCMIIAEARLLRFAYDMLRLYCTQPWETIE